LRKMERAFSIFDWIAPELRIACPSQVEVDLSLFVILSEVWSRSERTAIEEPVPSAAQGTSISTGHIHL
jgi:hypothetical protein